MAKNKLRSLQREIDRLLDGLEPGFKALVVVHNPDTGEGMMTNSCCDMCGFHLASHAVQEYLKDMAPEDQLVVVGSQLSLLRETSVDELIDTLNAPLIGKVTH